MDLFANVAVGLSSAASDEGLIRYAAVLGGLPTVQSVRYVNVVPQGASANTDDSERRRADLRSRVAGLTPGLPSSVRVECDLLAGPLTDALLAYVAERQVDLLVVGHGAGHPGRRALARRLAMKAPCSVWMVPEGSPPTIRRILAPIDFSDHAEDTLRVAVALARTCGAACIPLHVYFNEAVATFEGYDQILRGEEAQAYQKFVAPIDLSGVEVTPLFEEGANVAHLIHRVADREGADLIVMGTRGRSRSAAILLGSVTDETIMDARLPVLAVKHFGARMTVLQALLDRRFLRQGRLHTD